MSMPLLADADLSPAATVVFDDIRATRKVTEVNNFWRALAHDPALLHRTWQATKDVMAPGALDPLTKELIYLAISISNGCTYCIKSHGAAARAKGMTDAQMMELAAVIGLAHGNNRLATSLEVPVDARFLPQDTK